MAVRIKARVLIIDSMGRGIKGRNEGGKLINWVNFLNNIHKKNVKIFINPPMHALTSFSFQLWSQIIKPSQFELKSFYLLYILVYEGNNFSKIS